MAGLPHCWHFHRSVRYWTKLPQNDPRISAVIKVFCNCTTMWCYNAFLSMVYYYIRTLLQSRWVKQVGINSIFQDNVIKDILLAVLIFRCLHGLAPRYLSDDIRRVADTNRRLLRSASSGALFVRPTRLATMGDRAFPVAGSRLWNNLPYEVTSAPTLPVFSSRLKTCLFQLSFPPD